ncbi:hypothetical protein N7536_010897 [Penicillium majusculum]|uniref:Azaphilone pigments biosynthesis cluster protein L N-terminal domain-containing protein n=1 Tax=Penicillium solitum TaxID=60172 RepID=A0A1V6R432_9EURO|nr:uncharacterized protein PENSOL_c016G11694 [Penicillium solitum]KAJ5688278.1 hypothetical protein N7536_010897 [Penicillium majusculum]OQD96268.1 hypothetical protein PENSOL_c016G11694 [Penicillium solitum]
MAEVIGIASGLAGLVSLALQSSTTLFSTVQSLRNREKSIRDLRDALQDLDEVLNILRESISTAPFLNSGIIERPLGRCCKACNDFNALIINCSEHSTDNKFSIRDWAKLRYMGEDVVGFQTMISGYKSTITIALAYANMNLTKTTKNVIDEYNELIEDTKCDLALHLQSIEDRLKSLSSGEMESSNVQMMEEERESTQHGLEICDQFSAYIERTRSTLLEKMTRDPTISEVGPSPIGHNNIPWLILAQALTSAEREVINSRLSLLQHHHERGGQPRVLHYQKSLPQGDKIGEQNESQEEADNIKESLNFFDRISQETSKNRTNYFEDITTGDRSTQAVVSTLKDLISARRIISGSDSLQVLGQMSDDSLQRMLRERDNTREQ